MITLRKSEDRGAGHHGWLESRHTFSFAGYRDPQHMQFRALRVLNDDVIQPGEGFGRHPHNDMEIITWVLDGALAHEDSTGTKAVLNPGMAQVMSAGRGIFHSEFNASQTDTVHLLQIWIFPEKRGTEPRYEDRDFSERLMPGALVPIATQDGRDGSLQIGQDAAVYVARPAPDAAVEYALAPGRHAWVQVGRGTVTLNGTTLNAGDGAAVSHEAALQLASDDPGAEVLVFDLA